jgi:hypothetical protein
MNLQRELKVEAGHRCAITHCPHPVVELHHIEPWSQCKKHEFGNLIALCPNCHQLADRGEIDRKSLTQYKSQLGSRVRADIPLRAGATNISNINAIDSRLSVETSKSGEINISDCYLVGTTISLTEAS